MRRKEKRLADQSDLESIIARSLICRLGLSVGDAPYVVPLCFGYKNNTLYFHSADEGRKLDIIRQNSRVCFEFDVDQEIVEDEKACHWGVKYRSVIGFGRASIIESRERMPEMLDIIMSQYGKGDFRYSEKLMDKMVIIKVDIDEMTGKESGR